MALHPAKLHTRRGVILQLAGHLAGVTPNTLLRIKQN